MIKAVLFDNDGTLVDTYRIILASMRYGTVHVLGPEWKNASDEELMQYVGTPLDWQMVQFAGGDEEKGAELARVYRAHNVAEHDNNIKPFPNIPPLLDQLKARGIRMGVVTAKLSPLCHHGLQLCGIDDYMEVVVAPDVFPEVKPSPGPVLHGCEVLGVLPEECLYVGDSPYDMQAGNAAGCKTVAARWGMFSDEELRAENPTYEASDPLEILELL